MFAPVFWATSDCTSICSALFWRKVLTSYFSPPTNRFLSIHILLLLPCSFFPDAPAYQITLFSLFWPQAIINSILFYHFFSQLSTSFQYFPSPNSRLQPPQFIYYCPHQTVSFWAALLYFLKFGLSHLQGKWLLIYSNNVTSCLYMAICAKHAAAPYYNCWNRTSAQDSRCNQALSRSSTLPLFLDLKILGLLQRFCFCHQLSVTWRYNRNNFTVPTANTRP